MRNLRIGTKLSVSFGAIVLFLLCVAGFAIMSMSSMNALTTKIIDDRIPKMARAAEMHNATSEIRNAEAEHILANDPGALMRAEAVIRANKALIEKNYAWLDPKVKKPATRRALDNFRQAWDAYVVEDNKLLGLSRSGLDAEATALLKGKMASDFTALSKAAEDFSAGQLKLATGSHEEAQDVFGTARLVLAIALALAIAGTMFVLFLLIRLIARPLVGMTGAMGELAAGNMHVEVPVDPRADEVGDLAKAMASFRDQLCAAEQSKAAQTELLVSSIGAGLDRLARGDLTARIDTELTGPFAKLKADFNNALTKLSQTLGAVSQASSRVHVGASEISVASDELSHRTEQQAASLEESAAAMDQITATVREAASNAARANKAVAHVRREAEQSGDVVSRAVEAMGGIERASSEISEIISVIDGIAFQTNLLALNAGVEAARAGDAGKGFAVVASEVRSLAQRSADAAKDVKARILASSEQVEAGVALVSETGAALQRIISGIAEVDGLVEGIATSAEEQAIGLQQVNIAVGEMDGVTQQNAAMVEEATAASRGLAAEADALAKEIARFTLGQDDASVGERRAGGLRKAA